MANSLTSDTLAEPLAIMGGPKAVSLDEQRIDSLFHWPIVTEEDELAVLEVLRAGSMSGLEISKQFEAEFARWMGTQHALTFCNGTASLLSAMWACGVGAGDEVICPSMTYWASGLPALQLGAAVHFADIDPQTLCLDPDDIEHRIGPATRAIVVVHYAGHPADMDRIMAIARKHNLKVIEDVSHAHGTIYKGRKVGSIGDIGCMSMMAGKSFAVGEGGMMVTDDLSLYERCVAFGFYARTGVASNFNKVDAQVQSDSLKRFAGAPIGGVKHRMNQTCAALGRGQLEHYPARIEAIQAASKRFWDLLEGTPGLRPHHVALYPDSTMGGLYSSLCHYLPEELGGLTNQKFSEALRAEGVVCGAGCNKALHLHPVFTEADIFHQGQPTCLAFGQRDVRQGPGSLPVSEAAQSRTVSVPWFKHDRPEEVEMYAMAYKKVALQADKIK